MEFQNRQGWAEHTVYQQNREHRDECPTSSCADTQACRGPPPPCAKTKRDAKQINRKTDTHRHRIHLQGPGCTVPPEGDSLKETTDEGQTDDRQTLQGTLSAVLPRAKTCMCPDPRHPPSGLPSGLSPYSPILQRDTQRLREASHLQGHTARGRAGIPTRLFGHP